MAEVKKYVKKSVQIDKKEINIIYDIEYQKPIFEWLNIKAKNYIENKLKEK